MSDLAASLQGALGNPNVQNYLHMISSAEGTAQSDNPYAVAFGGSTIDDLSEHPGGLHDFTQTDGTPNKTSAAGAYQFIKPTWDDAQKTLNLPDFSPQSQDLAAVLQLHRSGSLQDVLNGDFKSAIQKDGKVWASLPTSPYAQNHRSQQFVDQALQQGSGGPISSAEAAPSGSSGDLSTVAAPKLMDAFERATAANDTDAATQISGSLLPRLQQGLQAAQANNDDAAVSQIQGMLDKLQPPAEKPGLMSRIGQGIKDLGTDLVTSPLSTMLDASHGAVDALSFGLADKALAAKASLEDGAQPYNNQLAALHQQEEGNPAFIAGQLGSAFIPGAGELSLVNRAVKAVPYAGRIGRAVAGGAAGATEGLAQVAGHADSLDDITPTQAALGLGLGAVGGSVAGAITPATEDQLINSFVKKAGSVEDAQRDAEVVSGLGKLDDRATQGAAKLGARDANALANKPVQEAADALRQLDKTPERQQLLNALDRSGGLNDADLAAIRQLPNGDAVADAIQMKQRVQAMTAPTPANHGVIATGLRMAADNLIPIAPVRHFVLNALGGRENRTANIAAALKQRAAAEAVLNRFGPSQATTSAQGLAQAGQSAIAQRAAAAQAAQVAKQAAQAQTAATAAQQAAQKVNQARQQASAANLANSLKVRQQQMAQRQAATVTAQQQAQAQATQAAQAQAARQAVSQSNLANSVGVRQGIVAQQQATRQATQQQAEAEALARAAQTRQNVANSVAVRQDQAAARQTEAAQSQEAAQQDVAQRAADAKQRLEARVAARQAAQAQGRQASEQAQAAADREAAKTESLTRLQEGNFENFDLSLPRVQHMLAYVDHPGGEQLQSALQQIARDNPDLGAQAAQLMTPGAKKVNYYPLQSKLQKVFAARQPTAEEISRIPGAPQAPEAAPVATSPALSEATGNVQNPLAYKAGIANRQRVQKAAVEAAQDPDVKKLITKMSTEKSQESRAALFNDFMKGQPAEKQVEAKRLAEPLISYGK